jgi:hypothetical protein
VNLWLRGRANHAETEIAEFQTGTVVTVSSGHTQERRGLVPTASTNDGNSGWKAIEWVEQLHVAVGVGAGAIKRSAADFTGRAPRTTGTRTTRSVGPAAKSTRWRDGFEIFPKLPQLPLQLIQLALHGVDLLLLRSAVLK